MKYSKCYFKEEAGEPVKPASIVAEQFNQLSDHRFESKSTESNTAIRTKEPRATPLVWLLLKRHTFLKHMDY